LNTPVSAALAGLHHAALSVSDVDASSRWYREVLGLEETFRREGETATVVVLQFPGLAATLGLVGHRPAGRGFAPHNLGLDHLAFRVASRQALWAWSHRLDDCGIANSGFVQTPFGGMLHFADPDGIALALFWERAGDTAPGTSTTTTAGP
jgi:glyoxylase I family protein